MSEPTQSIVEQNPDIDMNSLWMQAITQAVLNLLICLILIVIIRLSWGRFLVRHKAAEAWTCFWADILISVHVTAGIMAGIATIVCLVRVIHLIVTPEYALLQSLSN